MRLLLLLTVTSVAIVFSPAGYGIDVASLNSDIQQQLRQQLLSEHPQARSQFYPVDPHPSVIGKKCESYELKIPKTQWRNSVPVQVQCRSPVWSFYVSVKSDVRLPGLAPTRLIQRGESIDATYLEQAWFNATTLRPGLITEVDQIRMRTPRTALQPGQPIYATQLKLRNLVHKGDQVTIRALIGNTGVTSQGIALAHGRQDQQIAVRNTHSGRVIKVWVWDTGLVSSRPRQIQRQNLVAGK